MRLAIVSDTHLPRGARRLPDEALARMRAADLVVHAGDLMRVEVLELLEALGPPVVAVFGNVDDAPVRARLPERVEVDLEGGVRLGVVHDAGPAKGRLARMRRAFPSCDAVVFGHSHIPLHQTSEDGAFQLFNPGSPTERRRQPRHTMGEAVVRGGAIAFAFLDLD
ncbi:metallophosphoesterase [Conexibacter sp. SYSU D00693]|uniref:metallophosphoesterase family protein n=1 Tax=Conexibacter sp. SYSU D00693 TaxID=2812560 RepID=UPI00196A4753|nr:metallophosphoesterase family protein [Conexibacter sp. SYSU D00693]